MSAYTEVFEVAVEVENGYLTLPLYEWFEANGSPVLYDGDRIMIAEGTDWDAFTSVRVFNGKVPLKFRFRNKQLGVMFKLVWG